MKVKDIMEDESYPYHSILTMIIDRIRKINGVFDEEINDDNISYIVKDMTFLVVEPLDDGVRVYTEFYYERIVDLVNIYDVQYGEGLDGTDIISYKVTQRLDIQNSISLAQQAYNKFNRIIK